MGYEVKYDTDNEAICLKVLGTYTVEDAQAFGKDAESMLRDKVIRQLMVDLAEAGKFGGTEARKTTAQQLKNLEVQAMAIYNARPAVRIMGKILAKLTGGSMKAGFFATRDEALLWLKQERTQA